MVVGAANTFDVFTLAGGIGVGLSASAAVRSRSASCATVSKPRSATAPYDNGGDTEVIALSRKNVDSFDIAGGAGGIALAGSVGIWTFGGAVSGTYSYNDVTARGIRRRHERRCLG